MSAILKNSAIILLLFIIAGGVSFCLFSGATPMVGHDAASNHGLMVQILHTADLTSTNVAGTVFFLLTVIVLLMTAIFASQNVSQETSSVERQRYRENSSAAQKRTACWISIFERSPNAMKAA